MKLQDAIDAYVDWRRAHGAKFDAGARLLRRFCRHVGGSVDCGSVSDADVLGFLAGRGPLTKSRANKYGALAGFCRVESRIVSSRMPGFVPDCPVGVSGRGRIIAGQVGAFCGLTRAA